MKKNEQNKELSTKKVGIGNKILNLTIIISYKFCVAFILGTIAVALFYREYTLEEVISVGYLVVMIPALILMVSVLIKLIKISKE